jgi:hypothetical protein
VAFDATVLCGALLKPNGVEFELLLRAAQGIPFRGFTTEVVGMEFVRNAHMGFGAGARFRAYGQDELAGSSRPSSRSLTQTTSTRRQSVEH